MVANLEHFQKRLEDVHAAAGKLRCEAFVDYTPVVAGQRLCQLTLPSYNRLVAFECAFVSARNIAFKDIVCFIWVHHPEFGQFNATGKTRVTHAVWRALNPRFAGVQIALRFIAQLPRWRWLARFIRPDAAQLQAEAVAEIRRIIHEGLHDFPKDGPTVAGEPLPFAFQAQVLNLMRRSLGLSFAETCSIPLKALAQHLREVLHVSNAGKSSMLSEAEQQVWADYQEWRQSQVIAKRN